MNAIDLRQKKANLVRMCRENLEKGNRSQEDENAYNRMWAEIDVLDAQINQIEKANGFETNRKMGSNPEAEKRMAAYQKYLVEGNMTEYRALQADADAVGGYLIAPELFVSNMIQAIDDQVFIRQLADVQQIATALSLGQPYLNADPGDAEWTSELSIGSADSTMSFGKRELIPHPLARFIKVSAKLLRLSPNTENLVIQRLAYKFGIALEKAYMVGTGDHQPLGIFVASNDGISTSRDVSTDNTTTSIQTDGLKEAKYALKGGYWAGASWIFHRDVVKQIAKLQDDKGQYIWTDSIVEGEPNALLGFPVHISEYAPNTFTPGLYVGILGNFKIGYHIADSLDFGIKRLVELFAAENQIGFLGRLESDGMPVMEEAFVRVKLA